MNNAEAIKTALGCLYSEDKNNQAVLDCQYLLNTGVEPLIEHFRVWGVVDRPLEGDELAYKIQINKIESYLVDQKVLYSGTNRY